VSGPGSIVAREYLAAAASALDDLDDTMAAIRDEYLVAVRLVQREHTAALRSDWQPGTLPQPMTDTMLAASLTAAKQAREAQEAAARQVCTDALRAAQQAFGVTLGDGRWAVLA
jgi:hypothetical protein